MADGTCDVADCSDVRRRRSPKHFKKCLDCDSLIPRARRGRRRCEPCYRELTRQRNAKYNAMYRVPPPPKYTCQDCKNEFPRISTHSHPKRCPDCRKEEARRARAAWLWNKPSYKKRIRENAVESFSYREIFDRDGWRCGICRKRINRRLSYPDPLSASLDHIVPVSQGGGHVRSNVRASHLVCNVSRGARGGNEQLMLVG